MEERCELCGKKAMVYCDSDQAKLCWYCDATVHSANFLVAKHIRVLLCRICNSHTQWKASGPKLIPSSSSCLGCVAKGGTRRLQHHVVDDDGGYSADDSESGSDSDDSDDDNNNNNNKEEDGDEEKHVMPLYSPSSLDSSASALKRHQDNSLSINSNNETGSSSSSAALPSGDKDSSSVSSFRALKERRTDK
ncbi:hypothetical protein TanjilG_29888 [Lupinus angustifolius]|uniref:B box-type domain-containing protein n=1 Tax=Lupinus angustifolius TaxID=3871 RepID=A0A4P1RA60_LUPAN|nr:hypothetical protein TanjilG_29888 [Lupinus angustifolius]